MTPIPGSAGATLRRRVRGAWPVLLLSGLASCGEEGVPGAPAEPVMRDSAGVQIVESVAPRWTSAGARLSDRPQVEIRGSGQVAEQTPLDPAGAYRAANGWYVVADGLFAGWDEVMLFDEAGRYMASYGRDGRGPCEFGQLWWAQPYPGDSIAAHDYSRHKITIFDREGVCGREIQLPTWQPPTERGTYGFADGAEGIFADGSVLSYPNGYLDISTGPGAVWYRHALLRVSADGERWDSLGQFGISQATWTGAKQLMRPYAATGSVAIDGDGFWYGTGETFEVRRFQANGQVSRIVRIAREPQPLTATDRTTFETWYLDLVRNSREGGEAALERVRAELREVQWPERKPAYSYLLAGPGGELWVEEYRWISPFHVPPAPPPTLWSVFDAAGRWLGQVEVPGRLLLRSIGQDYVTGIWVNEDDTKDVRVYGLSR
jgi:hypothetical protein